MTSNKLSGLEPSPTPQKEFLAKWSGKLRSWKMNLSVKTRKGRRDTFVATRFSSPLTAHSALLTSYAPFSPVIPIFPVSGPAIRSSNVLHSQSNSLAVAVLGRFRILTSIDVFIDFSAKLDCILPHTIRKFKP
jgi:hypothetical protein